MLTPVIPDDGTIQQITRSSLSLRRPRVGPSSGSTVKASKVKSPAIMKSLFQLEVLRQRTLLLYEENRRVVQILSEELQDFTHSHQVALKQSMTFQPLMQKLSWMKVRLWKVHQRNHQALTELSISVLKAVY